MTLRRLRNWVIRNVRWILSLPSLGFRTWWAIGRLCRDADNRLTGGELKALSVRMLKHPVFIRPGSSDVYTVWQALVEGCYKGLGRPSKVKYIVDCGANIGSTSAYFLSVFPHAKVIAVECDSENWSIAEKNLAPYGERVKLLHAAVWSEPGKLFVKRAGVGDGREWAYQVSPLSSEAPPESQGVTAMTMREILHLLGGERVDIVKVDIEGAEAEVFSNEFEWLDSVDTLAIEIHGKACEKAVVFALGGFEYVREQLRETTVFRNIRRRQAKTESEESKAAFR